MRRRRVSAAILLSAFAIASLAAAQSGADQDDAIKLTGALVVLDAQVLSKKTALALKGLTRDDFVLLEDGVKQYISHFSQDKLPLSVVLLVDVSGSVTPDNKAIQRLLNGAIEGMKLLKPEDEVALMQFAAKATLVQPFTRDHDLVVSALARLDGRGQRGTNVDEGILGAASLIRSAANPDSRRVIIAITDDVTTAIPGRSSTAPMTQTEGEALRELYESGSVVSVILYESVDSHTESPRFKKGIARHFAEATGGITIETSHENLETKLSEMIERLRQRYTIGYAPGNADHNGKFRKIKLRVTPDVDRREGGVAVITRKGYYVK